MQYSLWGRGGQGNGVWGRAQSPARTMWGVGAGTRSRERSLRSAQGRPFDRSVHAPPRPYGLVRGAWGRARSPARTVWGVVRGEHPGGGGMNCRGCGSYFYPVINHYRQTQAVNIFDILRYMW